MSGTISIESSSSPMEGIETQIHDKNKKDSESLQLVESENKYEYEYESKPKSKLAANDAPETAASNATMSKKMKILLTLGFVSGFAALYGGLATLSQGLPCTTAGPSAISIANSRLHYFDESSLNGYEQCSDLQDDLQEAMEIIGNVTINSMADSFENNDGNNFNFICRGGGDQCSSLPSFNARPGDEVFAKEPNENVADGDTANSPPQNSPPQAAAGENSFETNNQVQGVDEADLIKSDGTHVFAAYADKIMVWNANDGTLLSTTIIPTHDDEGIHICSDKIESKENLAQSNDDCYHYKQPNSWWFSSPPPPIRVSSLMIHSQSQRLVVIASTQFALKLSSNLMQNRKQTRVFIYDISPQAIPNAEGLDVEIEIDELTLLARKDLDGTYQTARSIDEYAHIVTSSTLDLSSSLDQMLNPFTEEKFADMNVTEYRDAAHEILMGSPDHNGDSQGLAKSLAANLTRELIDIFSTSSSTSTPNDCSKLAKVALMLKAAQGAEQDSSSVLPSFTTNSVLKTLTLVHSLDISQPVTADAVDNTHTSIMTKPSGVFFPTQSYTSNVYASTSKLVVAGEAYVEDPKGDWEEHTILLIYNLFQDTSSPESVGDVPGSLLNQFSMDHHSDPDGGGDYLRVATTTWARWGLVDGTTWGQVEVSESQVTVLKMNGDTASLEIVGQATGIGSEERIYAVRFHGDRAYVVTFRQIDPFYTLNMTEPTDPRVVGELKIPGYSNYLHPIGDNLILALGQNTTEQGRNSGLQISLFNVSNFSDPVRTNQYVEDASRSTSDAQFDHKAFRYLPESKLLILPLSIPSFCGASDYQSKFFDGFVVYDVDETRDFTKKFNISHVGPKNACHGCWSRDELPSRSMVYDGNVMTLKGHTVLSHVLSNETFRWDMNLDKNSENQNAFCLPWRTPVFSF